MRGLLEEWTLRSEPPKEGRGKSPGRWLTPENGKGQAWSSPGGLGLRTVAEGHVSRIGDGQSAVNQSGEGERVSRPLSGESIAF